MLLVLLLLASSHPAAASCGGGETITLPTIRTNNAIFVDVMVNDTPGHFLLDTGAEKTTLRRSFFQRLGVQGGQGGHGGQSKTIDVSGFGGAVKAGGTTIRLIRAGAMQATDVDVTILDTLRSDGIIGLDLLSRYDVEFDLSHNLVVLHQNSLCPGQTPSWAGEITEMRAARQFATPPGTQNRAPNLVYITAQLNGQPAQALLDSGNGVGTTVNPNLANRLGISFPQLGSAPVVRSLGVGEERSRSFVFKDLSVAQEDFPAPRLLIAATATLPFDLDLGFRYFTAHRVWIDFSANRVFIAPSRPHDG